MNSNFPFGNGQQNQQQGKRTPRYGLNKIIIGSNHLIKGPDGINRQFQVKDLTRNRGPKLALCLTCKKTWENEEELLAAHPDEAVLRKQQESHPYGWWSDEPLDSEAKGKKDPSRVIGLLSDFEGENK